MYGVLSNLSSDKIPFLRNTYNFHSRFEKLKAVIEDPTPAKLMKNAVQVFSDVEVKKVVSSESDELSTKLVSNELKTEFYDPLSYMLAVDYQTYMNDDILQKVDRATMSTSLEGREPFLDQEILQWAAQLPSEYKFYKGTKKYLLKQIVYKHIPKEIMDRPKMGFSIPVDHWLSHELKDMVMDYLNEEKLNHGLFDKNYVLWLRDQFFSGKKNFYLKIWTLCMFQMWYYKWMSF
jgi:asparagine synthase (glutamine-hydrolysing)